MSERTESVIKGLQALAAHHDRPYSDWGNTAATAAIAEIDALSAEIARLREENETLRDHWPTFWKPLPVAVKEVGRE